MFDRVIPRATLGIMAIFCFASMSPADDKPTADTRHFVTSYDLLGANLTNSSDEKLGKIEDLAITAEGKIHYAIVGHGGVLGIGEDRLAVPFEKIQVRTGRDSNGKRTVSTVYASMTADQLKRAPSIKSRKWDEFGDDQWLSRNDTFYGITSPRSKTTTTYVMAKSLVGGDVRNTQDERIAKIDYLAFDADKSKLCYLLIDHEPSITDNELVPVPYSAVRLQQYQDGTGLLVRINATKASLDSAPKVRMDDIDRLGDREFAHRVDRAFASPSASGN